MSWSFQAVGKPEKVVAALEAYAAANWKTDINNFSRLEYEAALPHLVGIVKLNFSNPEDGYDKAAVRLTASGSASTSGGKTVSSSCNVEIERLYNFVE